jgi:2,4-dienoyl-CoA reductase-like NADH-dependent reductase (Old Yellow Enzyme family)/NADPH-dependent 2,4-dienoyl-CoA reductase/sulfur reductase-like enzyme
VVSTKFPSLFQPGQIGKMRIKNRIVMSPIGTTFWSDTGEVTERIIDYYAARAKGGAGLIMVSFAHPDYPPGYRALASLESERMVEGHIRLVQKLHSYGAKVGLQIMHSGRDRISRELDIISASPVRCVNVSGLASPVPRALEKSEIREMINRYGVIATNAKKAGYDMVEVHCAHGYLVNSFISPYLNKRSDEYGGSLENRLRFPAEIIKRIKEVTGEDYPVGVRISGDEFVEGGVTAADSPIIAQMLEEAGAAFIDISAGMEEVKHKSHDIMRSAEGWKSYIWEAIKKAVRVPTFAGGGHRTPERCEKIIAEGIADFVFLARQLLSDPEWPIKVYEGRLEEICKCISCLECIAFRTGRATETHCAVNVALGREKEFGKIGPAQVKKEVMIVGGGPGGMEAARIAALRGHKVALYDKRSEIGGNLLLASIPPGKDKLLWFRDYEANQLSKLNVTLKLGVEVTPELIHKTKPDVLIVATGSSPIVPKIPGVNRGNVLTAWDILGGKRRLDGQKVVVAGGSIVGAETAEFLAEQGNKVTLVEMLPRIAGDMEVINRRGLIEALEAKRVTMLTEHEVNEVIDKGLLITDKSKGEKRVIEADWVILALGSKPNDKLAKALEGGISEIYWVGDCKESRTILAAVYEGARAAMQI